MRRLHNKRKEIIDAILAKDKSRLQVVTGKKPAVVIYFREPGSDKLYSPQTGKEIHESELSDSCSTVLFLPDNGRDIKIKQEA